MVQILQLHKYHIDRKIYRDLELVYNMALQFSILTLGAYAHPAFALVQARAHTTVAVYHRKALYRVQKYQMHLHH